MLNSSKRRVKIVCTLGPSSNTPERIAELIGAGMDVARLNFSHGTHDFHKKVIQTIREEAKKQNKPVAIMQDLQGPKIRCGKLGPQGIQLMAGDVVVLYPEGSTPKTSSQGRKLLPISAEIAEPVSKDTEVGAKILFDDGKIFTTVLEVRVPEIVVRVDVGGKLTDNKGMNLPGTKLSIPCLTDKDKQDLKFGVENGVDAIALSFVRSAQDILNIRAIMKPLTQDPPLIISKIEREEAIEAYDEIIEVSDGLLVARGDMATEIGAERVPTVQKQLIHACNQMGVPIITATQMLESMIGSPTPTRAEASDVANAVHDGTDAVMLSGETASGQYPVEAVGTMVRIILEAERAAHLYSRHPDDLIPMAGSVVESIEFSASRIAHHVGATVIACLTHSGMAAKVLSKFRPSTHIVAIMDDGDMLRRLAFNWGVRAVLIEDIVGTDDLFEMVEKVLLKNNWAQLGDTVVVTAGIPTLRRGTTNMIKVHRIGAQTERAKRKLTVSNQAF